MKISKPAEGYYCLLTLIFTVIFAVPCYLASIACASEPGTHSWDQKEISVIRSLWIGSLPPLSKDPSNAYSDNPAAIALGKRFFFDSRFSGNMKVSCATCHRPDMNFTDDLPQAHGMGFTTRRSMPLLGVAYNTWFFWDGRKDSLWSQATSPIESVAEHGVTRSFCAHLIIDKYKSEYSEIFGRLPKINHKNCPPEASPGTGNPVALKLWNAMKPEDRDAVNRVYANMGKAIAAYVRTIVPGPSRFDIYAKALIDNDTTVIPKIFTLDEANGLRLFIGKAKCTNCHNGPLFTNSDFHNTGVPTPPKMPHDNGRADGIRKVLSDEFNCLDKYSDAGPGDCSELRYLDTDTTKYLSAFKTPTLRNVAERSPYMHAGQFSTLREVLDFYHRSNSHELGHSDLSDKELDEIEAFLRTLSGPVLSK